MAKPKRKTAGGEFGFSRKGIKAEAERRKKMVSEGRARIMGGTAAPGGGLAARLASAGAQAVSRAPKAPAAPGSTPLKPVSQAGPAWRQRAQTAGGQAKDLSGQMRASGAAAGPSAPKPPSQRTRKKIVKPATPKAQAPKPPKVARPKRRYSAR